MARRFSLQNVRFSELAEYRISVKGSLDEGLSDYLAGMRIQSVLQADGTTLSTLTGLIADQGELSGVLNALYEMHLPILAVEALSAGEATGSDEAQKRERGSR